MDDYVTVFKEHFIPALHALKESIQNQKRHDGWEQEVKEISIALTLWDLYFNEDDFDKEDKRFNEFMDYLKDNMRKWWC